ncbi:MAG: hypothetical protein GF347_00810 [Candidatus Moranbacteria bacterium]|nr:hypothetical protein [Candidatus Moranbacteria bacterium]
MTKKSKAKEKPKKKSKKSRKKIKINKYFVVFREAFKSKILPWLSFFLVTFLLLLIIFAFGIYLLGWNNHFVQKINQIIPFPVVFIDRDNTVSFNQYNKRIETIRNYHDLQAIIWDIDHYDLAKEEGLNYFEIAKKDTLEKMIEDEVTLMLLDDYELELNQKEIKAELDKIFKINEGKEKSLEKLQRVYNLNLNQFEKFVVRPKTAQNKLENHLIETGEIKNQKQYPKWFASKLQAYKIIIPYSKYYWDKDRSRLYFTDKNLSAYESQIKSSAPKKD